MVAAQPKILVYSPKQADEYADILRSFGFDQIQVATTKDEAARFLQGTEIILGWKFPVELLRLPSASTVRWFQSIGAGVDDLVKDKGIPPQILLTRVVGQFGSYIAEYVFSYLLYILKDIPRMQRAQQNHRWDPFLTDTLIGKTIGVAGLGSIGAEIVRKARAFDMQVYGLSVSGEQAQLVDQHFFPQQWQQFVRELDYLILTLPLTKETHHVLTKNVLDSMKSNACLVNVGRGGLIDELALVEGMEAGILRAAVLDVFEIEPLPQNHPLYSLPNVYVTSHLSGPSTVEGVSRYFAENLTRYLQNQPLRGVVNRILGY